VLFSSQPGDLGVASATGDALDVTIVRLDAPAAALTPLATAAALPLVEARARAYVVGHPRGGGLQIALHDSRLVDIDDDERLLHYRTPTDPGSSGSPVFNTAWEVIGLHHAGSATTPRLHGTGTYEANERSRSGPSRAGSRPRGAWIAALPLRPFRNGRKSPANSVLFGLRVDDAAATERPPWKSHAGSSRPLSIRRSPFV
jgi:hypothetical protein